MNDIKSLDGGSLLLGDELGSGGQATVYKLTNRPEAAAKIYRKAVDPDRVAKLEAMLASPPDDPTSPLGHTSIAWPQDLIVGGDGAIIGFTMPLIDRAQALPMLLLYNPRDRQRSLPGFTWEYLVRTARNLASALAAIHARGYVAGDLNESNILVAPTALVTLIDCDSMQVPRPGGGIFTCPVGKGEYTAPELQGADFATTERSPSSDNFALSVLIFLVLMEGVHPFAGVWRGTAEPPTLEANIKSGNSPYTWRAQSAPPPLAPRFDSLPPPIRALFIRALADGHENPLARPTAVEWHEALGILEAAIAHCNINTQHVYSSHLGQCPWCERMAAGIPDPFPTPRTQNPLQPAGGSNIWPASSGAPARSPVTAATKVPQPITVSRRDLLRLSIGAAASLVIAGAAYSVFAKGENARSISSPEPTTLSGGGGPLPSTPIPMVPSSARLTFGASTAEKAISGITFEVFSQRKDLNGETIRGERVASGRTDETGSVSIAVKPGIYILTGDFSGRRYPPMQSLTPATYALDYRGQTWQVKNISLGAGDDINYTIRLGQLRVSVNSQLYYYVTLSEQVAGFDGRIATGTTTAQGYAGYIQGGGTVLWVADVLPGTYLVNNNGVTLTDVVVREGQIGLSS